MNVYVYKIYNPELNKFLVHPHYGNPTWGEKGKIFIGEQSLRSALSYLWKTRAKVEVKKYELNEVSNVEL